MFYPLAAVSVYTCTNIYFSFLQLVSMLDIKEIYPEFQKLNKTDNCIVIVLKNETKLAITSPVSQGVGTWSGLRLR